MAVTTTRKSSAFVLVLKDIHFRNPGTALRSPEGSQGSLGKEWPEDCHSERSEESRSVPQASLGKEWLEGWRSSLGWSPAKLVKEQVKWQSSKGKWQN
jgi:hypothetical protein